jgi:hypothetical protein
MTSSRPGLGAARAARALVAAAALVAACADAGDGALEDAGAVVVDLDPCGFAAPPAALVDVSISYDVYHSGAFARIEGLVRDAPYPVFHDVVMEEGGCRYLEVAYGSCDPACPNGEVCVLGDVCAPYPSALSGGTLTVSGLGEPFEIAAEAWDVGTYVGPAGLPADLFDSSDAVGAKLEGGDFPAVAMGARGVDAIDPDLVETGFEMVDGQDAVITWTPGADPEACVRVVLNGRNATHGAPLDDVIECEGPDTGTLTIPQALVEALPHGATPEVTEGYDWPHSELTRYTRSSVDVEQGPARLLVRSTAYFLLSHPE